MKLLVTLCQYDHTTVFVDRSSREESSWELGQC